MIMGLDHHRQEQREVAARLAVSLTQCDLLGWHTQHTAVMEAGTAINIRVKGMDGL